MAPEEARAAPAAAVKVATATDTAARATGIAVTVEDGDTALMAVVTESAVVGVDDAIEASQAAAEVNVN